MNKRPKQEEEREERITMEIIVDCYNESEAWTGWFCYLENTLSFPFKASCIKSRKTSPLKPDEHVTVVGMLNDDEEAGLGEMMVEVECGDDTMGIPLAQIKGIDVDRKTAEAIADWHYWVSAPQTEGDARKFQIGGSAACDEENGPIRGWSLLQCRAI